MMLPYRQLTNNHAYKKRSLERKKNREKKQPAKFEINTVRRMN